MAKQRKHGTGTVRLRSDGRWEGRVVIGYDDSGLPKTKNVLAKTKTECEKNLKSLIAAQKGSEPQPSRQTMTAAQWLDFWYQTYKKPNLRPNTQMSYERRIYQHIIPNLGPIPLNKLTTGDIQQFYTGLKQNGRLLRQEQYGEGLSDQTVRGIHTTFHAALDKAVSEKIIPKNPSNFCRLPSAKVREMQVLSPEEIQRRCGCVSVAEAVLHMLPQDAAAPSPGMKYKHYAPAATLTLLCGSREDYAARVNEYYETLQRAGEEDGFYAMCFDEDVSLLEAPTISYGVAYDYPSQAQNLFDVLRQLDKLQATEVYVHAPEPEEMGLAVYNRLLRAAAFRVVHL